MKGFSNGVSFTVYLICLLITWFGSFDTPLLKYDSAQIGIGLKILISLVWITGIHESIKFMLPK